MRKQIPSSRLLFVELGRGSFGFPGQTLPVEGGSLLLLAPGKREARFPDGEPVSYLYVEFHRAGRLIERPAFACASTPPHFQTLVSLLWSIHREKGRGCEQLILAAIDLALFSRSRARSARIDPRIQRVLHHIDRHLDHPLQIPELAGIAGPSEPHFRRLFAKTWVWPRKPT